MSLRSERGQKPDYVLILTLLALTVIGILMVYSASVVSSYSITKNPNFYFQRQVFSVILGVGAFIIATKIHYTFWKKVAPFAFVLGLLLSALVFIPGLGMNHGGANRWIDIGPLNLQPSEFLKIGVILYLAAFFERAQKSVGHLKTFIPFAVILTVLAVMLMAQPDLGTFLVVALVSIIIFFIAGANPFHLLTLGAAGVIGIVTLIKAAPYRMARLLVFLNPGADKSGAGYQINQAMIAVGTGGLFGLGFNKSRQKYQYLPESQTDSIIAIMAEELGLFRVAGILALFVLLIIRGLNIAKKAPDLFARLVVIGVVSWVGVQTLLNVSANLSLVPLTGVPLPFISYGGSSIIVLLFAFGIVTNISKYSLRREA